MRHVDVEVLGDASHPEGGYAVMLLRGLDTIPDRSTFRLKPLDARGAHEAVAGEAWPSGDRIPLAVRVTEAGVEILIGPDIVECAALLPGTVGVIEIPAAAVRGEFLWPSIQPTARPKRRHLSIVKTQTKPAAVASVAASGDALASLSSLRRVVTGAANTVHDADEPATVVVSEVLGHGIPGRPAHGSTGMSGGGPNDQIAREPAPATVTLSGGPENLATGQHGGIAGSNGAGRSAVVTSPPPARVLALGAVTEIRSGTSLDAAVVAAGSSRRVAGSYAAVSPLKPHVRRGALIAASVLVVSAAGYAFSLARKPLLDSAATVEGVKRSTVVVQTTAQELPKLDAKSETVAIDTHTPRAPAAPDGASAISVVTAEAAAPRVEAPLLFETRTDSQAQDRISEVTLRLRGGGFEVTGELKGFDGTKYVVETRTSGTLTMEAARFDCIGAACTRPVAAILPADERPSVHKPDSVAISGAVTLGLQFMPHLIRDYAASLGIVAGPATGVDSATRVRLADSRGAELATIEFQPASSFNGRSAVERGTAAIGLLDQPNTADETAKVASGARKVTPRFVEHVIGVDGVAILTSPAVSRNAIPVDMLAKVFAGQITDWFDLGQAPGQIQLVVPVDGTGTTETFRAVVLKPRGLDFARTAQRVPADTDASELAARDARVMAIGAMAETRKAKALGLETACGLVVRPTSFAVKTGEYPLVRKLSLYAASQPAQPSVKGMMRLVQWGELQSAVTAAGVIDQSITLLPLEEQAERMAWAVNAPAAAFDMSEMRQMLANLAGATRLSVTLRFVAGTNELDAKSRRDVARLAGALKEPELAGKRIILAGFTDSAGKFQANLSAASRRASQVRSVLLTAAGPGFDQRLLVAHGYGPLAPVACNGTPQGTRLNRRVEVWVAGSANQSVARGGSR